MKSGSVIFVFGFKVKVGSAQVFPVLSTVDIRLSSFALSFSFAAFKRIVVKEHEAAPEPMEDMLISSCSANL
jgi:hypothetical protein